MLGKLRPPLRRSAAKSSLPLVALVTDVSNRQDAGLGVLIVFFATGAWLLAGVAAPKNG